MDTQQPLPGLMPVASGLKSGTLFFVSCSPHLHSLAQLVSTPGKPLPPPQVSVGRHPPWTGKAPPPSPPPPCLHPTPFHCCACLWCWKYLWVHPVQWRITSSRADTMSSSFFTPKCATVPATTPWVFLGWTSLLVPLVEYFQEKHVFSNHLQSNSQHPEFKQPQGRLERRDIMARRNEGIWSASSTFYNCYSALFIGPRRQKSPEQQMGPQEWHQVWVINLHCLGYFYPHCLSFGYMCLDCIWSQVSLGCHLHFRQCHSVSSGIWINNSWIEIVDPWNWTIG